MTAVQADLFAAVPQPIDPELMAMRRRDIDGMLHQLQTATANPYRDLTQAYLAERRFESLSSRLPDAERDALREAFVAELIRLKIET